MNASVQPSSSVGERSVTLTVGRERTPDGQRTTAGGVLAAALPVAAVLSALVPAVAVAAAVSLFVAAGSALVLGSA